MRMSLDLQFVFNFERRTRRPHAMDIPERYTKYLDNIRRQKLRESQQGTALAAAPAMLARLREQVVEQVNEYNSLFTLLATDQHCRATFEDLTNRVVRHGFSVSVGNSSVRVVLQDGTTVICFEFFGDATKKASTDCVEARPDDAGNPGYWYGKDETFVNEEFLADRILDPVLCG
jgi:hypothetical protein